MGRGGSFVMLRFLKMNNYEPEEIQFLKRYLEPVKAEVSTDYLRRVLADSAMFLAESPFDALKADFDRDLKRLGNYLKCDFIQVSSDAYRIVKINKEIFQLTATNNEKDEKEQAKLLIFAFLTGFVVGGMLTAILLLEITS